jgi:hypothetical protein
LPHDINSPAKYYAVLYAAAYNVHPETTQIYVRAQQYELTTYADNKTGERWGEGGGVGCE